MEIAEGQNIHLKQFYKILKPKFEKDTFTSPHQPLVTKPVEYIRQVPIFLFAFSESYLHCYLASLISFQLFHRLFDDEDGDSDSEAPFLNSFEETDKLDKRDTCKLTAKVVFVSEEKITKDKR